MLHACMFLSDLHTVMHAHLLLVAVVLCNAHQIGFVEGVTGKALVIGEVRTSTH
jgi:hypothetical protein